MSFEQTIQRPVPRRRIARNQSFSTVAGAMFMIALLLGMAMYPIVMVVLGDVDGRVRPEGLLTFILIGIFSLGMLIRECFKNPYSLNNAHWAFIFIFFFIGPIVQYMTGQFPDQSDPDAHFGPAGLLYQSVVGSNLLILVWMVAYGVAYEAFVRFMGKERVSERGIESRLNHITLLVLALLAFGLLLALLGIGAIRLRGAVDGGLTDVGRPVATFANVFVRALPFAAFVALLAAKPRARSHYFAAAILFVLGAVTNHPLAVPRFWFAALAIGTIAIVFRDRIRTGFWLPVSLLASMLFLMPILNVGRGRTIEEGIAMIYSDDPVTIMVRGDLDAYSMLSLARYYVDSGPGPRMGFGTVSGLLAFVPRQFWPEKSPGSGADVGRYFGFAFLNLSCPAPAEGYLDFGIGGTLLYAVAFAFVFARGDRWYWCKLHGSSWIQDSMRLVYPMFVGGVTFLVRGSFQSAYAYLVGLAVACAIAVAIGRWGVKKTLAPDRAAAGEIVRRKALASSSKSQ